MQFTIEKLGIVIHFQHFMTVANIGVFVSSLIKYLTVS